jgi:hypothetical protein
VAGETAVDPPTKAVASTSPAEAMPPTPSAATSQTQLWRSQQRGGYEHTTHEIT